MLTVITAPHGGGKTRHITELLRASVENGLKPIFIVPEQFHFETEYRLYKELGASKIGSVNVTSFTKLSKEILSFFKQTKPYAYDIVKEVIMQKTLQALDLQFYNNKFLSKTSARLISVIADFQKQGITAAEIEDTAKQLGENRLAKRLLELSKIYSEYSQSVTESLNDRLDDTRNAAVLTGKSDYFKDTQIFLDGFDGFSGSQLMLIREMIKQASVAITLSNADSKEYLYTTRLLERLEGDCKKNNVAFKKEPLVNNSVTVCRKPKQTELYTAPDVYSECDFVAASIRRLITEENYRLSDIAVLTANGSTRLALSSAFNIYDIKGFTDIPEPIIEKPLVRFILTVLKAVMLEPDGIMEYIKSGFVRIRPSLGDSHAKSKMKLVNIKENKIQSPSFKARSIRLPRESINRLENAQNTWQLKKNDWENPFPKENRQLNELEPLRKEIIGQLSELRKRLVNTTGNKITEALADFLIYKMEIPRTVFSIVNKRSTEFKSGYQIDRELNSEYRQLWEMVISIFESMYQALGNYEISSGNYAEILASVFSKSEIARPPQVIDAVTVGDVERTRVDNIKVIFIIGVNQNIFPPKSSQALREFVSTEVETLFKAGLEITDDQKGRYYKERYIAHKALMAASERLYITAPLYSEAWKPLEISAVFRELMKSDNLFIKRTQDLPLSFWMSTEKAAILTAARVVGDKAKRSIALSVVDKEYGDKLTELYRMRFKTDSYMHKLQKSYAERLLKTRRLSPSAIAGFNNCRFKYFCEKGLRLGRLENENDTDLTPIQRGNLIHHCLEEVLKRYPDEDFMQLSEAKMHELISDEVNLYVNSELMKSLPRSKRQWEIIKSYIPDIVKLLLHAQSDMAVSRFRPYKFEEHLKLRIGDFCISGTTDRIDILTDGDDRYLKIIDYKTGVNNFRFPELYYGQGWQALIYMKAVLDKEPDLIPTGAVYQSEGVTMLSGKSHLPDNTSMTPENQLKDANWQDSHRIRGVEIAAENYPAGINDFEAIKKLYAEKTGTKSHYVDTTRLTKTEYDFLIKYLGVILKTQLNKLSTGDIAAIPLSDGNNTACRYCDFSSVCMNAGKREVIEVDSEAINDVLSGKVVTNVK